MSKDVFKTIGRRNCWSGATKDSPSEQIVKGEPFMAKTKEQYNDLITGGAVKPPLPERVQVVALTSGVFNFGKTLNLKGGEVYILDSETYLDLVLGRHVRPLDPNTWTPESLVEEPQAEAKKLYEEGAEQRKGKWITAWMTKRGGGK